MNDFGRLESFVADLIAGLEPAARKALAQDLARSCATKRARSGA